MSDTNEISQLISKPNILLAASDQKETLEDETEILKLSIIELRKTFDRISNIYDQLRIKAMGVLGGEVAVVTFMFSGNGIPIPTIVYGRIFFFVGIVLLGIAFGLLLWTISPLEWKMPYDQYLTAELKARFRSSKDFLVYLNDDHVEAVKHCQKYVGIRGKRFTWTIYLLSVGAIILMVIKFGGAK